MSTQPATYTTLANLIGKHQVVHALISSIGVLYPRNVACTVEFAQRLLSVQGHEVYKNEVARALDEIAKAGFSRLQTSQEGENLFRWGIAPSYLLDAITNQHLCPEVIKPLDELSPEELAESILAINSRNVPVFIYACEDQIRLDLPRTLSPGTYQSVIRHLKGLCSKESTPFERWPFPTKRKAHNQNNAVFDDLPDEEFDNDEFDGDDEFEIEP